MVFNVILVICDQFSEKMNKLRLQFNLNLAIQREVTEPVYCIFALVVKTIYFLFLLLLILHKLEI